MVTRLLNTKCARHFSRNLYESASAPRYRSNTQKDFSDPVGHNFWSVLAVLLGANFVSLSESDETCNATLCGASADLPVYRASDVRSHTSKEKGIWVSYKDGVFDITNFVVNHPGGSDKIMLAAVKLHTPL